MGSAGALMHFSLGLMCSYAKCIFTACLHLFTHISFYYMCFLELYCYCCVHKLVIKKPSNFPLGFFSFFAEINRFD